MLILIKDWLQAATGPTSLKMITTALRLNGSILCLACWFVAATSVAEPANDAKVDKLFSPWDHERSPGAAVVIVKDGAVAYTHGYGYANLEDRVPITQQTIFDAASVAKQFTGLSIAMLAQKGKISLDEEIRKYLPDLPDFGKPIYIHHLLHHTSGLRDWPETLSLSGVDMSSPITLETILEMVRRQRELDFAPGEEHSYSNTGYNLLAAIVAKATGHSFRTWTAANIFEPLGMNHTEICENPAKIVPNRAMPYMPAGRGFERVVSQLAAQGSSSLFISADDIGKWLLNFESAAVGGTQAIEMMHEPGKLNNGNKVDYAFGVELTDYNGDKITKHTGSWAGYRSIVLRVPGKRFGIAILSNLSSMPTERLAREITDLYLGYEPGPKEQPPGKPVAEFHADPSLWKPFTGTYRLGPGWLLSVTQEGTNLMAQATREPKFAMTALSSNRFLVKAYGSDVEFVSTNSDRVTHLMYRGIHAPKLRIPPCNPDLFRAYAGDFWSEELRVAYRLEVHEGDLGTRHRSGTWVRLLPTDTDAFDTDPGGLSIVFTRDSKGEISELKVSAGRMRNIRFRRVADLSGKEMQSNDASR